MNADILLRLVIAVVIIAVGVGLYALHNQWMLRRAPKNSLGETGKPVLLYFTTPTCVPCKTIQKPAITQIQEKLGEMLRVIEVDATEQPEMAERWGVLSVPTTFVIDSRGQARYVNHGVARADKLLKQLKAL